MRKLFNTQILSIKNSFYKKELDDLLFWQLKFDLGEKGDLTSKYLLKDIDREVTAKIVAKGKGILAGMEEILWFLKEGTVRKMWPQIKVLNFKKDGTKIKKGDLILEIKGLASEILGFERVILNLLQRMSGIATATKEIVDLVKEKVLIAGTRKTAFGLLDKKAIVIGGGVPHRLNLSDAVLIKDNHLKILKDNFQLQMTNDQWKIFESLEKKDLGRFLEVEVESLPQALEIAKILRNLKVTVPKIIMLDNFSSTLAAKTVQELKTRGLRKDLYLEVSGGINKENVRAYAKTGVDVISMGSLTHSMKAVDMSMEII